MRGRKRPLGDIVICYLLQVVQLCAFRPIDQGHIPSPYRGQAGARDCNSLLNIDGQFIRQRCQRPKPLSPHLNQHENSSTALILWSKSESDDGVEGAQDNFGRNGMQQQLGERFGRYVPTVKTATLAFSAGSIAAVTVSVVLFYNSLQNDKQYIMRNGGGIRPVPKSFTSTLFEKISPRGLVDEKTKAVELYRRILEQLDGEYVEEVENERLFEVATQAMLKTLDPYTEYVSPQDIMQRNDNVGIGAFVMKEGITEEYLDGKPVSEIISSIPSTVPLPMQLLPSKDMKPEEEGFRVLLSVEGYAYDAGLRVGDVILKIDDQSIVGENLESARGLLVGASGSKVKISFKRPGIDELKSIYVERDVVQFPSVPYYGVLSNDDAVSTESQEDIGYIKLERFGLDSGSAIKEAIQSMQSPDGMKGLIIDLRDNSGGELISAVQIASLFFPDDTYLGSSEGKGARFPNEIYRAGQLDLTQYGYASSGPFDKKRISIPGGNQIVDTEKTKIVLLINKKTASASEFLAGSFQDLDKAVIIGVDESTKGKGIGQREMGLPNEGGALKVTYHEFYTPSGRCVQRKYRKRGSSTQIERQSESEKTFYTANGRLIKNRRGVEVDYRARPKESILNQLLSKSGAYFAFATDYCSGNVCNAGFIVDDKIYNEFKSFVLKEQSSRGLKLGEAFDEKHRLQNMQKIAEDTELGDSKLIQTGVANLEQKIAKDLLSDFETCKDIISRELELNILARTLPESDLARRSLKSDSLVREAMQVIQDTERYNEILGKPIR